MPLLLADGFLRLKSDRESRTLFGRATVFMGGKMFLLQMPGCRVRKEEKHFKGIIYFIGKKKRL